MATLIIANKTYSSWSMRPWLAMRHAGIGFDEIVVSLAQPDTRERLLEHSPAAKAPILRDGDVTVWESLAIIEYLAETRPEALLWPADRAARAHARAISAEMHAGFQPLRRACPMNLRKRFATRERGGDVDRDVARIAAMWADCRTRFGAGGPFLFGAFTAADAMYAPVVTRLDTYSFAVDAATRAYMDAVLALPAFAEWKAGAMEETWIVPKDEVDEPALENA